MEKDVEIIYNNSKYILVNNQKIDGEEIYHFINYEMINFLISDEQNSIYNEREIPIFSLFCTKENEKYIPIKDKKREIKLLEEFGMMPETIIADIFDIVDSMALSTVQAFNVMFIHRQIKPEARAKFIQEQKENYRQIKQKLGTDIDLKTIEEKLDGIKVNIFKGKMRPSIRAFYAPANDNIFFKRNDIESEDVGSKRTRLHETNHYIAGERYACVSRFNRGLMEGMNENLVADCFDDNTSSFRTFFSQYPYEFIEQHQILQARVQYNFSEDVAYPHFVALVKQLEYVTGTKSYDSAINGNNHFLKAIVKELGIVPTIKLCAITNLMTRFRGNNMPLLRMLETLQDMIMQTSFDKKFKKVQSVQDAKEYLERLRGFEKYRGKITYLSKEGDISRNNSHKEYYESKFQKLQERFRENSLEQYRYKEQEMRPLLSEKEEVIEKRIRRSLMDRTVYRSEGDISKIEKQLDIQMLKNGADWTILKINGKSEKGPSNISEKNMYLFRSMVLKNVNKPIDITEFMKSIGATSTSMRIEFTEKEIQAMNNLCKRIQEDRGRIKGKLPKKISLIDRIRKSLFDLRKRKEKLHDKEVFEETSSNTNLEKKPSWDLSNWKNEDIPGNQPKDSKRDSNYIKHEKPDIDID